MPTVLKSQSLNLLEPSGPVQACNGIPLPLTYMDLYVVFMYNFLCMSTFHSAFQFLPYLRGNNMTTSQGILLVLWILSWHFKVPSHRNEEMLNKVWCIFMWTYVPICKWHRNDMLNHTTYSRLTVHTTATLYLYLTGLQDSLSVTRKWDSPLSILMLVFLELCRSQWNDWWTMQEISLLWSVIVQMGHNHYDKLKIIGQHNINFMALNSNTMKQDRSFHIIWFLNFSDKKNECDKIDGNHNRLQKIRTDGWIMDKLNIVDPKGSGRSDNTDCLVFPNTNKWQ
jgi:hypothetical protein